MRIRVVNRYDEIMDYEIFQIEDNGVVGYRFKGPGGVSFGAIHLNHDIVTAIKNCSEVNGWKEVKYVDD